MRSDKFESAFDKFLESSAYDKIEAAVFQLAREAFEAGWTAAGGETPDSNRIVEVLRNRHD